MERISNQGRRLSWLGGLAALLFWLAPASAAQEARQFTLEELLGRLRATTGVEARGQLAPALLLRGESDALGLEAGVRAVRLPGGRYSLEHDSALPVSEAFDGRDALSRDWSGATRRLSHADREHHLLLAWFASGFWLEKAAPVVIELAEGSEEPGPVLLLSLAGGRTSAEVLIDTESWLPRSLQIESVGRPQRLLLDDWREVRGVKLPFEELLEEGEAEETVTRYESAKVLDSAPEDLFDAIRRPPENTRFLPDGPGEVELKRAPTGHLLVQALVDGADRGYFILDTGAGTLCISPEIADACEMDSIGQVEARGVAGSTEAGFRTGQSLTFGPLVIEKPIFVALDLSFLEPHFGVKVAGICGAEVFCRAVVEIDLGRDRVRLSPPGSYELPGGEWSELSFEKRLPCFPGRFEGDREGLFRFDSGSSGEVELDADTVLEFALLEGRETGTGGIGGVGGFRTVDFGPLAWFEVAGHRYENVTATFSRPGPTAGTSVWTAGVIGLGMFPGHTLVFDYAGERFAILAP